MSECLWLIKLSLSYGILMGMANNDSFGLIFLHIFLCCNIFTIFMVPWYQWLCIASNFKVAPSSYHNQIKTKLQLWKQDGIIVWFYFALIEMNCIQFASKMSSKNFLQLSIFHFFEIIGLICDKITQNFMVLSFHNLCAQQGET